MDNSSEKKYVYEQMKLIIEERRELTKHYYELKERLDLIDHSKFRIEPTKDQTLRVKEKQTIFKKESEYQRYMLSKKSNQSKSVPYQIIGLTISSILKEAGRPLSNKEIYTILNDSSEIEVKYKNLTMNILPKMDKDSKMNVERAYRGFWQYRLTKI
ncbi:hypothetical protein E0F18_03115 [Listeria monocytogenes]|uniref:hypothetical protein n=1 Tax=Listeria monocytogenes TaxID=1639 RepID=UPI00103A8BBC|nr:hypothetical protein [Listeria monocytogenes]EAF2586298.1 hypothetical protein [Listeria monocytogenes]EAG5589644.1 hypothetical protein [Listeria monocytogenes]MBI1420634.1 hypothetical protein [Listeria monocytogenes]TCD09220.1 hypothetical protein E0F18_03115 [Listeria monocytogenes]HAA0628845.1 hypothetical protein [Listeria monocytogenes]